MPVELNLANRRSNANQNQKALEQKTLVEQCDKRSMIEQELADTNETLSDQTC